MVDFNLKYQATLFANNNIQANTVNISTLLNLFMDKGLLPNIQTEVQIFSSNPQNFISLQSQNGEWVISFRSNRIDIEKRPINVKGSNLGGLESFCSEAKLYFDRIIKHFNVSGNRLGFVTGFILNEMSNKKLEDIYLKIFNSPNFYKENVPFEWNWRTVANTQRKISEKDEDFNFVTSINRLNAQYLENNNNILIDRIELSFDINTSTSDSSSRFNEKQVEDFLTHVHIWHDEIKNEVLSFLN